jgi:hypothetical protein
MGFFHFDFCFLTDDNFATFPPLKCQRHSRAEVLKEI